MVDLAAAATLALDCHPGYRPIRGFGIGMAWGGGSLELLEVAVSGCLLEYVLLFAFEGFLCCTGLKPSSSATEDIGFCMGFLFVRHVSLGVKLTFEGSWAGLG